MFESRSDPWCVRCSEVKLKAVYSQTLKHCHLKFLGSCVTCSETLEKGYCSLVTKLCLTLWDPMDCSLPSSSVHWISQASGLPFPSPGGIPDPGIEPMSIAWQVDSLPLSHLGGPLTRLAPGKLPR